MRRFQGQALGNYQYDANVTALTEYVYLDHLGTPRAAKNASGALVWRVG